MSTWKDFPKILFLLEQANECLGRGHDIQQCRDFLNAYLLDISVTIRAQVRVQAAPF